MTKGMAPAHRVETMMDTEHSDELVRLDRAAKELGVSSQTVKKYCRCQLLKCRKLPSGQWRVYRSSLDAACKPGETYPN